MEFTEKDLQQLTGHDIEIHDSRLGYISRGPIKSVTVVDGLNIAVELEWRAVKKIEEASVWIYEEHDSIYDTVLYSDMTFRVKDTIVLCLPRLHTIVVFYLDKKDNLHPVNIKEFATECA